MITDWVYGPSKLTTSQIWARTPFTTWPPKVSTPGVNQWCLLQFSDMNLNLNSMSDSLQNVWEFLFPQGTSTQENSYRSFWDIITINICHWFYRILSMDNATTLVVVSGSVNCLRQLLKGSWLFIGKTILSSSILAILKLFISILKRVFNSSFLGCPPILPIGIPYPLKNFWKFWALLLLFLFPDPFSFSFHSIQINYKVCWTFLTSL